MEINKNTNQNNKDYTKDDFLDDMESRIEKLELKTRSFLSRHQFFYALIGAAGVVLYWRGIWHTADILESKRGLLGIIFSPVGSMLLGIFILSITGLLVSAFIGSDVIISGLKKRKKDSDKTLEELVREDENIRHNEEIIKEIDQHLHSIEKELHEKE